MRIAVVRFPGANCEQDALFALRDQVGVRAEYVWHEERDLRTFDGVFLPGGFTYGDYLRCGAMASRAPVMDAVRRMAREGAPVIGVCNGFQILCEAGLLPGALMRNERQKFLCKDVWIRPETGRGFWMRGLDRPVRVPIAHGEGRFFCDGETLRRIEGDGLVAFRYCDPQGRLIPEANPNGSLGAVAGLINARGNVLGLMPHPERATHRLLGSTDGLVLLDALRRA
jgi:phosphoribosylformylglycinamidine synthase